MAERMNALPRNHAAGAAQKSEYRWFTALFLQVVAKYSQIH
jgi:hypothetical protein